MSTVEFCKHAEFTGPCLRAGWPLLGLVVHTFDPNMQEAEAGGGQVLSQPGLDPVSEKMVGGQRQEGHLCGGE